MGKLDSKTSLLRIENTINYYSKAIKFLHFCFKYKHDSNNSNTIKVESVELIYGI